MFFFVVVLLKRMSYNKEKKRQAENERSQNKDKKAIMANSAPDPKILPKKKKSHVQFKSIRIFAWVSEMSLHSWKKTGTGLGGRAVSS